MDLKTLVVLAALSLAACGGGGSGGTTSPQPVACNDAVPWQDSDYVIPYTVGESYFVNQANCSGFGHSGFWQYGYDFSMPVGTVVTAARAGVIVHAQDGASDGDRSRTNLITVRHEDGIATDARRLEDFGRNLLDRRGHGRASDNE